MPDSISSPTFEPMESDDIDLVVAREEEVFLLEERFRKVGVTLCDCSVNLCLSQFVCQNLTENFQRFFLIRLSGVAPTARIILSSLSIAAHVYESSLLLLPFRPRFLAPSSVSTDAAGKSITSGDRSAISVLLKSTLA